MTVTSASGTTRDNLNAGATAHLRQPATLLLSLSSTVIRLNDTTQRASATALGRTVAPTVEILRDIHNKQ
jgi:hypothetical protein